jgi:hypothetical protein
MNSIVPGTRWPEILRAAAHIHAWRALRGEADISRTEAAAADEALANEALDYFKRTWRQFHDVASESDSPPELVAAFRARTPPVAMSDSVAWIWSWIQEGCARGARDARQRRTLPRA